MLKNSSSSPNPSCLRTSGCPLKKTAPLNKHEIFLEDTLQGTPPAFLRRRLQTPLPVGMLNKFEQILQMRIMEMDHHDLHFQNGRPRNLFPPPATLTQHIHNMRIHEASPTATFSQKTATVKMETKGHSGREERCPFNPDTGHGIQQ